MSIMTLSIKQLTKVIRDIKSKLAQHRDTDKDTKVKRVKLRKRLVLANKKLITLCEQNIAERRALHDQQSAQMASLNARLAALKA